LTNVIFKQFSNMNTSLRNLTDYRKTPTGLMIKYLHKSIEVDSEETFLYGIILWTLTSTEDKPLTGQELKDLLGACDFTKLSLTYLLYVPIKLIKEYKKRNYSNEVTIFIEERRKLAMETRIGGLMWLEKSKPTEFINLKKRTYKKDGMLFQFEINALLSGIPLSDKLIYFGFTFVYLLKLSEGILEGSLDYYITENDRTWIPVPNYSPIQSIDIELSSENGRIPSIKENYSDQNEIKRHIRDISEVKWDIVKITVNLQEEQ